MNTKAIIDNIAKTHNAAPDELMSIIKNAEHDEYLYECADKVRREHYGNAVYIRGLIEISNYCRNNCLYCGIRRSNRNIDRYRLNEEEILECCEEGYALGFRTFVMQGGEDCFFDDDFFCGVIRKIKDKYPDCAITLSLGERSEESYKRLFEAGADRYLLRHETANEEHYSRLHPEEMSYQKRMECLKALKKIGFQTGAGFMVGSPYQTAENLVSDLLFIKEFKPQMVGIGPFIPHKDTPFGSETQGTLRDTLVMVALTRLLLPDVLLPSTTALGTIHPEGREMGLRAGANVVMPNLSPLKFRKLYMLYDNKIATGDESAQLVKSLAERVKAAGYEIVTDRGDWHA